jgi:pimeloyl-ACP methyl ester carboxylesterase
MGSTLIDDDDREVWGLSGGTLLKALTTLGGSINALTLPADIGDGPAPDGVRPGSLMPALHAIPGLWTPIEGYSRLVKFLRRPHFGLTEDSADTPGNLVLFPYDWRLSNRRTATLLKTRIDESLGRWRSSAPERAEARVVFVCHSMGGLVARWYLERLEGWKTARALITLGTPHRGALKSLAQLVNGISKGIGPLKVDLTRFARSLPSAYQLLPEYACLADSSNELRKTVDSDLPMLDGALVRDGMAFYTDLNESKAEYQLIPVVGIGQPTPTTATLDAGGLESLDTIEGEDLAGDGTVPRLAARPKAMKGSDPTIRGVVEGHGLLAGQQAVLDQLNYVLTAEEKTYKAVGSAAAEPEQAIGVSVPDLHAVGETVRVEVRSAEKRLMQVAAIDESGKELDAELVRFGADTDSNERSLGVASFEGLPAAAYTMIARAPDDHGGVELTPVGSGTLVW